MSAGRCRARSIDIKEQAGPPFFLEDQRRLYQAELSIVYSVLMMGCTRRALGPCR